MAETETEATVGQPFKDEMSECFIRNYFESSANEDELPLRAENEVGEKQRWKHDDILALRDLMKQEKVLKPDFEDTFLVRCLRARSFDYENAHELIKNYNKLHISSPHLFSPPHKLSDVFEDKVFTILPQRTDCDETILVIAAGRWSCLKYDFDTALSALVATLELVSTDVFTQICGIVAIIDMSQFNWVQLRSFGPLQAKKMAHIIEEALPIRFKAIHIVNDSLLTYIAYSIIKPFLSQELRSKIEFHKNNFQAVHRMIPPQSLPSEIGSGTTVND
ncbi:alpha-tocopherol transfer protein-like protein [Leptotrombidium deliense]|uniref:Alpha-tocopherol transfer protein-like protein n=1 Tax=Leptotrombidium deliense TaxID=299467 RepID=A0A443SP43_9ACAR|nr:alpha-tocopherol transfer protein-like protein [Leptotrombidium deliense]